MIETRAQIGAAWRLFFFNKKPPEKAPGRTRASLMRYSRGPCERIRKHLRCDGIQYYWLMANRGAAERSALAATPPGKLLLSFRRQGESNGSRRNRPAQCAGHGVSAAAFNS